jgi:hypothetical protein
MSFGFIAVSEKSGQLVVHQGGGANEFLRFIQGRIIRIRRLIKYFPGLLLQIRNSPNPSMWNSGIQLQALEAQRDIRRKRVDISAGHVSGSQNSSAQLTPAFSNGRSGVCSCQLD